RMGEQHVRLAHIERDVAPVRTLGAERVDQRRRAVEGLGEEQPAPAAVERDVMLEWLRTLQLDRLLPTLLPHAAQPLPELAARRAGRLSAVRLRMIRRLGAHPRRHGPGARARATQPATAPSHAAA